MAQPKQPYLVTPGQMSVLQDYWEIFGSEKGQKVLADMKKDYCGSCFSLDAVQMAFLNGQRQVILNIEETLSLKDKDVIVEEEKDG